MELIKSIISSAIAVTPVSGKVVFFDTGLNSERNLNDEVADYKVWLAPPRKGEIVNRVNDQFKNTYNCVLTITSRNNGTNDVDIQDTNTTTNSLIYDVDSYADSFKIKLRQQANVESVENWDSRQVHFLDDDQRCGVMISFRLVTTWIVRDYCLTGVSEPILWGDGDPILWGDGTEIIWP